MGLDQYLYEERYISRFKGLAGDNEHYRTQFEAADQILELANLHKPDIDGRVVVRSTAMYWRKANQIHKWFVDNVQDGVDDCGTYDVSREDLETLRDLCQRILRLAEDNQTEAMVKVGSHVGPHTGGEWVDIHEEGTVLIGDALTLAIESLPTGAGFFFGSTDYDNWYLRDLEETVEGLTRVLDNQPFSERGYPETDFFYSSSW